MAKPFLGLAHDLADSLRRMIRTGALKPGDKLLPEREYAEQLGVNRQTLRNAIGLLCSEGLLTAFQGKGTFVAPPKYEINVAGSHCMRDAMAASGYRFTVNTIYEKTTAPADYALQAFGLAEGEQLHTQLNILYLEEEPLAYETVYQAAGGGEIARKQRVKLSLSTSTDEESLFLGISAKSDVIVERCHATDAGGGLVRLYAAVVVGQRVVLYN